MLVAEKPFLFHNGFYYDKQLNIVSAQNMRDRIAKRYTRFKPQELDIYENTIREHNRAETLNPREIYLKTISSIEGESFILNWLKEQYPDVAWEQVIYDIIMHKTEKMYVFHGIAEAGKSQLMDMLKYLFKSLAIPMTVEQLNNKFNLGETMGKLLIAGDDLGRENFGKVLGLIKSMATGAKVGLEQKYKRLAYCENKANFLFCTNNAIQVDITDEGVLRRFVIFTFDKKMKLPCNYNEFREKYIENSDEVGRLVYQLRKVEFDESVIKALEIKTAKKLLSDSPANKCGSDEYKVYGEYCKDNGYKPLNKANFEKVRSLIVRYGLIPKDNDLEIMNDNAPF